MVVGGIGVTVGGSGVTVGGIGVSVAGIAVGGIGVSVGGTGVGGSGVTMGAAAGALQVASSIASTTRQNTIAKGFRQFMVSSLLKFRDSSTHQEPDSGKLPGS